MGTTRRTAIAVLTCSAWVTSSGCATLLRTGLRAAGVEVADESPASRTATRPPESPTAVQAPPAPGTPPPAVYRHVPIRGLHTNGPTSSQAMLYRLFRSPGFDAGCQPVPLGLQQVLPVPNGAPAAPLGRWGPFEVGVQGPAAQALEPGYLDGLQDGALLGRWAHFGDQGWACGFRSQLYLRLTSRGTTPVAVHR